MMKGCPRAVCYTLTLDDLPGGEADPRAAGYGSALIARLSGRTDEGLNPPFLMSKLVEAPGVALVRSAPVTSSSTGG
jgi:hypothetical protein